MPKGSGGTTRKDAGERPLRYTGLFVAGLRLNVPWERLVEMQLPRLVMMLEAAYPAKGARPVAGARDATQADIDALLS